MWRTAVFTLPAARFRNRQNGSADFRLNASAVGIGVRRIQVVRPGLRAERYSPGEAFQSTLYAEPGRTYAIESSVNLVDWTALESLRVTNTTTPIYNSLAARLAWQWYRARRL